MITCPQCKKTCYWIASPPRSRCEACLWDTRLCLQDVGDRVQWLKRKRAAPEPGLPVGLNQPVPATDMTRETNRDAFTAMLAHTKAEFNQTKPQIKYSLPDDPVAVALRKTAVPRVSVTDADCVDDLFDAVGARDRTARTLIVNSASLKKIGGGVLNGATAQEEHLCRRSNLYHFLTKSNETIPWPLHGKVNAIYCRDVTFYLAPNAGVTRPLHGVGSIQANVLSLFSRPVGAEPNTYGLHARIFKDLVYWLNRTRIDVAVVVPVGCGVFKHPPEIVAKAFYDTLEMYECYCKEIYVSCYGNARNVAAFTQATQSK